MKKFNVPTKMDVILQLITSKNRKPHFTRKGKFVKAKIERAGGNIWVIYDIRTGSLRIHISPYAPLGFMAENLTRWDRVYDWAKRVDANRHRWDK